MRKRKVLLGSLAGLAIILVGVLVVSQRPLRPARVTLAHFDRIKGWLEVNEKPITVAEVESLIGGPPDDYTTGPTGYPDQGGTWASVGPRLGEKAVASKVWQSDTGCIRVDLGPSGAVVGAYFVPCSRTIQGTLDNLLWRAKRQWHRWFS
jgi:hypothetical protein